MVVHKFHDTICVEGFACLLGHGEMEEVTFEWHLLAEFLSLVIWVREPGMAFVFTPCHPASMIQQLDANIFIASVFCY